MNTAPAAVRETHSAVVLLWGDRAYKAKKPVDLGFLDFSTRQARLRACHEEVRLNRRLTPDVYLGVADVIGPDGELCDHLVVMRRMPDERRLSTLVEAEADVSTVVRQIARDVAAFHARAPTGVEIAQSGSPQALTGRWRSNIDGVRRHATTSVAGDIDRVERLALRYVDGRGTLLAERVRAGLVRDGHGDLLAGDVFCLDDGPRVLDCLEFDDRLRWMDVLDDVCCLAMDLERLGARAAAEQLLAAYEEFSGTSQPVSLRHHYVAYRALMRAKVAALRAAGTGDDPVHETAVAQTATLVRVALGHLEEGRVRLVVVGGPPASGKSTIAGAVADRLGATLLTSDRVRKEVHGRDPCRHAPAALDQGLYDEQATRRTYQELAALAASLLRRGENVVVDASFTRGWQRQLLSDVARDTSADLDELRCSAPASTRQDRLRARRRDPAYLSDADAEVGAALAARTEAWPTALVVDTGGRRVDAISDAHSALDRSPDSDGQVSNAKSTSVDA